MGVVICQSEISVAQIGNIMSPMRAATLNEAQCSALSLDPSHLPFVSVVVPALNEEANLAALVARLEDVLRAASRAYEIIIVDDGSTDNTRELLCELSLKNPNLAYLSLSRNFGHQAALIAGLDASTGQVVIMMDADFQHPPELLPKMIALWQQGYQVVYTIKIESVSIPFWKRVGMEIGYGVIRRVTGMALEFGQSDFRLLDRQVARALENFPERDKFLRGLVSWVGFRQIGVQYKTPPRFAGKTKYTLTALVRLVASGVFGFSILPLRLFTLVGVIVFLLSCLYAIWAVVLGIHALITGYSDAVPPGWASIAAAMAFLGGVQLIGIGLLGEYIGRIYDEAKHRPIYIVNERSQPTKNE